MTAATEAPAPRRVPRAPRTAPLSAVLRTTGRMLRIELRHSPMPLILPLIAALFWFDSYRPSVTQPPIWALRTFWNMGQGGTIIDFGPIVAGMAAWIASREARRGLADLVTATARPRWVAQLAAWAAAAVWAVGSYLVFVGVMFAVYIHQGAKGVPPLWWVAVGATAVAAFSAAGFAVGAFFPSRFAAPLATFAGFLVMIMSSQTGFRDTIGWAQILPTNSNGNFQPVSGIFYPWLPDLPIARIMFLAGIAVAALGLLGLAARADGPGVRRAAAAVTLAGVAAAGTAVGLADTARVGPHGMVIPALHDAASDRPIAYTPVCARTAGVPVCLNPAYGRYLSDVTAALRPVLAELAGLPGAPARAAQVAGTYASGEGENGWPMSIGGHPPVLRMPLDTLSSLPAASGFTGFAETERQFANLLQAAAVHVFVRAGNGSGTLAQQAVQAALLLKLGMPLSKQPDVLNEELNGMGPPPQPVPENVTAAARRLAALPPAARHAWLAAHLGAVRSGQLALGQVP